MLVGVTGFGSVWRRRIREDGSDRRRFAHTSYFNTTGVMVNGRVLNPPPTAEVAAPLLMSSICLCSVDSTAPTLLGGAILDNPLSSSENLRNLGPLASRAHC